MINSINKIKEIFKVSSEILGNQVVYSPIIRRSILSLINILTVLTAISLILYSPIYIYGWVLLAFQISIMLPFSVYYHMRMRFIQSLLIHSYLVEGVPLTFSEAAKQISSQKIGVLTVAILESLINRELRARQDSIDEEKQRSGILSGLVN